MCASCLNQRHEGGGRPVDLHHHGARRAAAGVLLLLVLVGVLGAAVEELQAGGESEFDEDFTWPIFIPICFK